MREVPVVASPRRSWLWALLTKLGLIGIIALGYGVVSDITTRAERGIYVGMLLLG